MEVFEYLCHNHVSPLSGIVDITFPSLSCMWVTGGCICIVGKVAIMYFYGLHSLICSLVWKFKARAKKSYLM